MEIKDPRIRTASVIMLSIAAFSGMWAAAASIFWVILFSGKKFRLPSLPAFIGLFAMVGAISIVSWLTGSGGISYFVRMCSLIVIAVWAYSEIKPGEILDTLVWLLGERTGFELGLTAETAMSEIRRIPHDFRMTITAASFKGRKLRCRDYIAVTGNILIMTLRRAGEQGKVLARRGYVRGGTHGYVFFTTKIDIFGLILAIGILSCAFIVLVRYL